jgi:hypothetical protein
LMLVPVVLRYDGLALLNVESTDALRGAHQHATTNPRTL